MAQATFKYGINLKALLTEMYPDATNTKDVLDEVMRKCEVHFNTTRDCLKRANEYERLAAPFHKRPVPDAYVDPGDFADICTIEAPVTMGTTYNEVVTVDAVLTITTSASLSEEETKSAVNILKYLHVEGTFYIEPTFRVTAY